MTEIICKAIKQQLVVKFQYEGKTRIVESFTLGIHKTTGNLVLRSYRIGGFSKSRKDPSWRLFIIKYIYELEILNKRTQSDRKFYNPNDSDMSKILCYI